MAENYNTVEWYLNGTADQKRKAGDWIDKLNEVPGYIMKIKIK
eukprot:SAG11_NODE_4603_length_1838_cov_3.973548_2_plen_43_part_00